MTQVLRLQILAPTVREAILGLGDPMEGRVVGAHTLRSLVNLPGDEQERLIYKLVSRARDDMKPYTESNGTP